MALIANDVANWVSLCLHQPYVNTTLSSPVVAGLQTATPGSMRAIFAGASVIVGVGTTREIVAVVAVTTSTFDAVFVNSHAAGEAIVGATFPKGQTDHPIYTQSEILGYLADVQNRFLTEIEPVYAVTAVPFIGGTRVYAQPTLAMRVERVSISGRNLKNTTQTNLDLQDPTWRSKTSPAIPTDWYQDDVNVSNFGYKPTPQVGGSANLWHSVRGPITVALSDSLSLPDIFAMYLKYGILARCYSKDGEMRDPARAQYCDRRFEFGMMLSHKFMDGIHAMLKPDLFVPRAFRALAVPPPEVNQ